VLYSAIKMAQRVVFFICGVVTVLVGRVYSGLQRLAPPEKIEWLHFPSALLILGAIAVCVSFLPTRWVGGVVTKPTELRLITPFKFLLSFAALGLLLVVVFSFVPPTTLARPPIPLVYSLCPACVLTATVDPSLTTAVFFIAPLNALVWGAIGGVIGTAFVVVRR
jgi:hypothetical protein